MKRIHMFVRDDAYSTVQASLPTGLTGPCSCAACIFSSLSGKNVSIRPVTRRIASTAVQHRHHSCRLIKPLQYVSMSRHLTRHSMVFRYTPSRISLTLKYQVGLQNHCSDDDTSRIWRRDLPCTNTAATSAAIATSCLAA